MNMYLFIIYNNLNILTLQFQCWTLINKKTNNKMEKFLTNLDNKPRYFLE